MIGLVPQALSARAAISVPPRRRGLAARRGFGGLDLGLRARSAGECGRELAAWRMGGCMPKRMHNITGGRMHNITGGRVARGFVAGVALRVQSGATGHCLHADDFSDEGCWVHLLAVRLGRVAA